MSTPTASLSPVAPTPDARTGTAAVRPSAKRSSSKRGIFALVVVVVVLGLAAWGWPHLQFALAHVETDDAQVEGDISPVLPRVSGYVTRVAVQDNQHVTAGQPVLEVDARELDLKVASAGAALATAQATLATAKASVLRTHAALSVAESSVSVAGVRAAKAESDLKRDTALFKNGAITDRQLSDTQAAADVARAENEASRRQVGSSRSEIAVADAQVATAAAEVQARQSELDFARLQRSYATVTAPISGIVSRKNVEPGQLVQAGQTLLSIASDTGVWVVANYKETQMAGVHPGQTATITVDAYPGTEFTGRVDSIAGATGARFALLPPDNASGNFIKVTQRVPVKLELVNPPADRPLRAGMSVDAAILTK